MSALNKSRGRVFSFVLFPHIEEHKEALKKLDFNDDNFTFYYLVHERDDFRTYIMPHVHLVVYSHSVTRPDVLCNVLGISPDYCDILPFEKFHFGNHFGISFVTYFSNTDCAHLLLFEEKEGFV